MRTRSKFLIFMLSLLILGFISRLDVWAAGLSSCYSSTPPGSIGPMVCVPYEQSWQFRQRYGGGQLPWPSQISHPYGHPFIHSGWMPPQYYSPMPTPYMPANPWGVPGMFRAY